MSPRLRVIAILCAVLVLGWVSYEVWLRFHPPQIAEGWSGLWASDSHFVCIDARTPSFEYYRLSGENETTWGGAIVGSDSSHLSVSVLLVHVPVLITKPDSLASDSSLVIDGRTYRQMSPNCTYGSRASRWDIHVR